MKEHAWVIVLFTLLTVASVTQGAVQELCATLGYLGIGVAVVLLLWRKVAARHTRTR